MATDYGDIRLEDQLSDVDIQVTVSGPASPFTLSIGGNITAKRLNDITGAVTINFDFASVPGGAQIGDQVTLVVEGANSTPGTITWGTGIIVQSGATTLVTVANKKKICLFTFDGDGYFLHTVAIQP